MQVTNNIIYECLYLEHKMNLKCLFWPFFEDFSHWETWMTYPLENIQDISLHFSGDELNMFSAWCYKTIT
jgi:hypothetical protein